MTAEKHDWPIHARVAWEHEKKRGDRLYESFCAMEREHDEQYRAREAAEAQVTRLTEALREQAIDSVTAGANPQKDGTFSPPLWHSTCRLCGARWSKQGKRDESTAHPPHDGSIFRSPCLLAPATPPATETQEKSREG